MKAVVTGGSGFIGSHLCASLLDLGHEVVCVDNFSTGSIDNLAPLLLHPRFTLLAHDVTQPLPAGLKPGLLFHLASPASVSDYLRLPEPTLLVNSVGTLNLLDLARRSKAKFLYTSTSEIYGDPHVHPQPETYWGNVNSIGPRACYSEAKRFGEAATMVAVQQHQLDARVVRIFNTYGPHSRSDDGRIVPNFVMQALRNEPLTVYGDGSQTRSYCYVSDLVRGLLAAMFTPDTAGEVFNLGNPDEYTVRDFAQIIAHTVGSTAGLVHLELPEDDPTQRRPDISKAKAQLGWRPEVDLTTGIKATIDWFRRREGFADWDSEQRLATA